MAFLPKILKTYDPKEVRINWNGIEMSGGFAPSTFLSITPDASYFNTRNGIGGKVTRVANTIPTATVNITLMQNSDANKELMSKLNTLVVGDNSDLSQITITDSSRSILVSLNDCYIESIPDFALGEEYGEVNWTFKCSVIVGKDVEPSGFSGISGFISGLLGG